MIGVSHQCLATVTSLGSRHTISHSFLFSAESVRVTFSAGNYFRITPTTPETINHLHTGTKHSWWAVGHRRFWRLGSRCQQLVCALSYRTTEQLTQSLLRNSREWLLDCSPPEKIC
jgi:hypothetical protein